jgi:hypothetical protein
MDLHGTSPGKTAKDATPYRKKNSAGKSAEHASDAIKPLLPSAAD